MQKMNRELDSGDCPYDSPVVVGDDLDVVQLGGPLHEPQASLGVEVIYTIQDDVTLA